MKKLFLLLLPVLIALNIYSQEKSGVLEFAQGKITELEEYRKSLAEDPSEENKKVVMEKARNSVMDMLEFDVISRMALGKYYSEKTPQSKKQMERFRDLYRRLMTESILKINLPEKTTLEKKNPLKLHRESNGKDKIFNIDATIVHGSMISKKIEYKVDLYFYPKNDRFYLYDVRIDGASTLLDYRNYFYQTISNPKKGMDYLIQKLTEKVNDLENGTIKKKK